MIDTILFDLDGTLVQYSQEAFIEAYFAQLAKVFIGLGMEPESSLKAVWDGTRAMARNDGTMLNTKRFWNSFAKAMNIPDDALGAVEAACNNFYVNEFNEVKTIAIPNAISQRIVRTMNCKGYTVVLATNPMFPECAVSTRLGWIGLELQDFLLVTHYANSTYCKPNHGYFHEILAKIDKLPEQCLMVGNHPVEDMVAGELGTELFLVTDYLENEAEIDITAFQKGTLKELETYLTMLPNLK